MRLGSDRWCPSTQRPKHMPSLPEVIQFWIHAGWEKFLRVFWFFVLFDFLRYLVLDIVALSHYYRSLHGRDKRWDRARDLLYLERPLVSVIVPGKNEGKHLHKLTQSIREQTYQHFELIVVDDGSDDHTAVIGRDLERAGLIDCFISNQVRGGKASGANTALGFARGEYIIHLDADCSFDFDAFEQILLPFYLDRRIGAVGGNLEVRNIDQSLATRLQGIEYLKSILVGRMAASHMRIYRIISGAFGAFRTDVLKRLGGWDIGPGLDGDITVKFRKLGYRIFFQPTARGLTSVPDSFRKLAKQRMRWDRSIIRFRVRKHRDIFHFNANFRWRNMLSSADNIFFNVVLNFKWYFYLIDILLNFSGILWFIIIMNLLMYTLSNVVQFILILTIARDPQPLRKLFWYTPLMVPYVGYFLRVVRTLAHLREIFFRSSYNDAWNPYKSSQKARSLGI